MRIYVVYNIPERCRLQYIKREDYRQEKVMLTFRVPDAQGNMQAVELMTVEANGDIHVRGRKTDDPMEITSALREFARLSSQQEWDARMKMLPAYMVDKIQKQKQ